MWAQVPDAPEALLSALAYLRVAAHDRTPSQTCGVYVQLYEILAG